MRIITLLIITCALAFNNQKCYGQLSVFYTTQGDVIGVAVAKSNARCARDAKAKADFYNKGGDDTKGLWVSWNSGGACLNEEYGCYAVVKGKSSQGQTVFGYCGGGKTLEEALDKAKSSAIYHVPGALENTIQVITSGCIAAPAPPPIQSSNPTPQWSNWISGDCFKKISYKYMGKELVNLNYQYHYYFQAKNDYSETVYFIMSLKDADGKERFGTRYSIRPGQTIEFVEKMDRNYIKSFAVEKVCFKTDDGKYVACDDERKNIPVSSTGNKTPSSAINRAEIERDAKKAIDIFCRYWELDGRSFDLRMKGKTDEKLDKEVIALEKELEKINIQMGSKYDENKNKVAYDLYNKFWGEGYDKCPYKGG